MSQGDYENDARRSLQITDPTGNQMSINKPAAPCKTCGLSCKYEKSGQCKGNTHMLDDLHEHLCEFHQEHGSPNNWYVSQPQKSEGPIGRMLGMQGDNVKELSNWGGTYKDENDTGEDYEKSDPRYTDGKEIK